MALFDRDNPVGEETKAALALADLIAAQSRFQELCNESTEAAALTHITVGVVGQPFDGNEYTIDELADLGLQAWLTNPPESPRYSVDGYGQASSAGTLMVHLRRYVRTGEELQDVFLWFWDRLCAAEAQLNTALSTATCPRVQQGGLVRTAGPAREQIGEEVAQGSYLWAEWSVDWGDAISD